MQFDVPRLGQADAASRMRVAAIQLASSHDVRKNCLQAERGISDAASQGARLVVLAEKWNAIGERSVLESAAESLTGPTLQKVCEWSREHGVWIVAGSIVIREPGWKKLQNISALCSPEGEIVATYTKSHMFDVDVAGVSYRESDAEDPGNEIVLVDVDGISLGMTVCYDLRFPELYRLLAMQGARIITVPAAFTLMTGRDHWEVLLRARAIENQCFIIAPNIIGSHGDNKLSYGRSMIIDPWGTVLAQAPDSECVIVADLDLAAVDRVRASIPSLLNRRDDLYTLSVRTPSST